MPTAQSSAMKKITTLPAETDQDSEAFQFPQGMAGFPDATKFGFIYEGHGDIVCIQCLNQPEAAFLLAPWDKERLGPEPTLNAEQAHCIHAQDDDEILWMIVLNPFADKDWVTANLKAPIALNISSRHGLQCIRIKDNLDIRFRWMPQPS